ncbi:hypothetical protein VCHA43P277_160089 [Vibrio chagasii]|nr:hypothetical protein VCHA34P126_140086 [Vibrio chagasii]CAH6985721.1 hypothetical protein VCHA43P277_160089 [Vibrio chagasii]CAH7033594.1 hypothetical protein VCHA41O247_160090 [Vibrio chagasii]
MVFLGGCEQQRVPSVLVFTVSISLYHMALDHKIERSNRV